MCGFLSITNIPKTLGDVRVLLKLWLRIMSLNNHFTVALNLC